MQKHPPKWLPWLLGALAAAAMLGGAFLLLDVRYMGNDDTYINKSFLGQFTGHAPGFHLFLHTFLTWGLMALSNAMPGVSWYGVVQLALLWLALTVLVKSLCQCAVKHDRPLWVGLLMGCGLIVLIGLQFCIRISFTTTAALLCAAAVAQVLSVDYERASDGSIVRSMMLALALLALGYSLRQITALPGLAFCAIALAYEAWARFGLGKKRSLKPLIVSIIAVAAVFAVLVGARAIQIRALGLEPLYDFEEASGEVLDYGGIGDLDGAVFETLGWPASEVWLISDWYMLDSNITTDAYRTVAAARDATAANVGLLERMGDSLRDFMADPFLGAYPVALGALGCLWLLGLLLALLKRGEPKAPRLCALLATLLLAAAMIAYLAATGRLPLRAAMMAFAPMAALTLPLLLGALPRKGEWRAANIALTALLLAGALTIAGLYTLPTLKAHPAYAEGEEDIETELAVALDEYGMENPDTLVIYDTSLAFDKRIFPDTSMGVPTNLMLYGGWTCRTPEYYEQLARFGIDGHTFTGADFLRENVVFARGIADPPPHAMLDYLRATVDPNVQCDYIDNWGYVHFFQFSIY